MWNKLSFRLKITAIFSICLTVLTLSLTTLSMMNARQSIAIPMQDGIQSFYRMIVMPDEVLDLDGLPIEREHLLEMLTSEQMEEFINLSTREGVHIASGHTTVGAEGAGILTVGELLDHLDVAQNDFMYLGFWMAGIIIVLGSLAAYFVSGVIVQPIKQLSTSVTKIEADKLNMTLPLPKSNDEISQLTASFNGMLDKLHRSFESKQLFAQNAAHELKTPLTIMRAHMQALEMETEPTAADYEEVLSEIKTSTERMIGLVEGLLAMGKSPTEADTTVIRGRDIFEEILLDLKALINAKQITIQLVGDMLISGNKTLLFQAFFNLIHNAIRYNVENGRITITMTEKQIIINDTGIGIPTELLDQLFDPFYCVDDSRSKKLGGNGLGLAITKHILDAHKMTIDITSEVGAGTCISIHI